MPWQTRSFPPALLWLENRAGQYQCRLTSFLVQAPLIVIAELLPYPRATREVQKRRRRLLRTRPYRHPREYYHHCCDFHLARLACYCNVPGHQSSERAVGARCNCRLDCVHNGLWNGHLVSDDSQEAGVVCGIGGLLRGSGCFHWELRRPAGGSFTKAIAWTCVLLYFAERVSL